MRVLSDTSPLNYLVQIGQDQLLPALFGTVVVATAVAGELDRPRTPAPVRRWFVSKPPWLVVHAAPGCGSAPLPRLHDGERETLDLALATGADLILMDDRAGVAAGRACGFRLTGTLGILDLAGRRNMIDVPSAVERLRATNFRLRPDVIASLLNRHGAVSHG